MAAKPSSMFTLKDEVSKPLKLRFVLFLLRRIAMRKKVFCWWDEDRGGWNISAVVR